MDVVGLERLDKALSTMSSESTELVGVTDIVNLLLTIYDPLTDLTGALRDVNIPLSVDLVLNWLLNVFDR